VNKDELLAALEDSRAAIDEVLADLDPNALETAGVSGAWSVKDVLAHLTAWQVEILTNLGLAQRGQKPSRTVWDDATIEAQNQAWYQQYRNRPLERVTADYDGVHRQMVRKVTSLAEKDLAAPLPWSRGRSLSQYIVEDVVEHEAEHLPALQAWLQTHSAAAPEADDAAGVDLPGADLPDDDLPDAR
jgi:uncharacterized damage-inducible protein DinB